MFAPSLRARGLYPGCGGESLVARDPLVASEIWHNGTKVGGSELRRDVFLTRPAGFVLIHIAAFDPAEGHLPPGGEAYTLHSSVEDVCGNRANDVVTVVIGDRSES